METITINDVGPRDGLQNQKKFLEPVQRAKLVDALLASGMRHIEAGAFVSPKAVPMMAGAAELMDSIDAPDDACMTWLVPNVKGYELATEAGARSVSTVLYSTESMAQANVRMSMAEAEAANAEIARRAAGDGVNVIATVSVAFHCPYEGKVDPVITESLVERVLDLGVPEFAVADTIGAANPMEVREMMDRLVLRHGPERLSCHFHDTRAMGVANVFAAIESGIRKFDASIAGLGGCPFAPGATGNVATEDVALLAWQMGFDTGIDMKGLMAAAELAKELTGTAPGGRSSAWLSRNLDKVA